MQCGRLAQRNCFDPRERFAAFAFHHVAGQRPGTASKTDQRNSFLQFGANQADSIHDVAQIGFHIGHMQALDRLDVSDWELKLRAVAFDKMQPESHRIRNRENI